MPDPAVTCSTRRWHKVPRGWNGRDCECTDCGFPLTSLRASLELQKEASAMIRAGKLEADSVGQCG